jgi:hypothetical protein
MGLARSGAARLDRGRKDRGRPAGTGQALWQIGFVRIEKKFAALLLSETYFDGVSLRSISLCVSAFSDGEPEATRKCSKCGGWFRRRATIDPGIGLKARFAGSCLASLPDFPGSGGKGYSFECEWD